MSWTNQKYINFRASSGFVTDGTNETYDLGAANRALTLDGDSLSFGWGADLTSQSRDRNPGVDRHCAGIVFNPNAAGEVAWSFTLPSGTYDLRLALGDIGGGQNIFCSVYDNTSLLATIASNIATTTGQFVDANGNVRTSDTDWTTNNTARSIVLASTSLVIKIGDPTTLASNSSTLACVGILQTAAAGSSGPPVVGVRPQLMNMVMR
jgi:hypothetical protein